MFPYQRCRILTFILCSLVPLLSLLSSPAYALEKEDAFSWSALDQSCKPWTYWWWMGSAVDKESITALLEDFSQAGMGGVHIIPIYGAKGYEDKYLDYLSPEWMEMFKHTLAEAKRLDLGVDMSTGTGWPFGGPMVNAEDAAKRLVTESYPLKEGKKLRKRLPAEGRFKIMAVSKKKQPPLDLSHLVTQKNRLDWQAPKGDWTIYTLYVKSTEQQVKRAAPGAKGNVLDPFSPQAMQHYLNYFDQAFQNTNTPWPRAQYHDSYEYYKADWTNQLCDAFEKEHGYALPSEIAALHGDASPDRIARVRHDYRATAAQLLLDFIRTWCDWAKEKGCLTRNQAHGSPGNLLDLYAAADIPETEIFGPSAFPIPGLRTDPDFNQDRPNPLMIKFASSAAHVAEKPRITSETCTWLGNHFQIALSQAKPELDQLFVSGINHVFFHGMPYSPPRIEWPGWLFYAATNFSPTNSFWHDIPAFNAYIARCQSVLQSGTPDNDLLLYFPIHDLWNSADGEPGVQLLTVHKLGWLQKCGLYDMATPLWEKGYGFDYISDTQIQENCPSKTILIPNCHFLPTKTLQHLIAHAEQGNTIIFVGNGPDDVPGLGRLKERRKAFNALYQELHFKSTRTPDVEEVQIGKGRFLRTANLETALQYAQTPREAMADTGLKFIRRKHTHGYHYFITNLTDHTVDQWVPLATPARAAVLLDPRFATKSGLAALRTTPAGIQECYLQLAPGESCILRTFTQESPQGPSWPYRQIDTTQPAVPLTGPWHLHFIQGGPTLPHDATLPTLASWTALNNDAVKTFSGTAQYTLRFQKPKKNAEDWLLDLGKVCETAHIRLNGQEIAWLISLPFRIPIGDLLQDGENTLEIEVTNLDANRIADLDRRKVNWQNFHDINFVDIRYKKFDAAQWPLTDSGLLGPVQLIPMQNLDPSHP